MGFTLVLYRRPHSPKEFLLRVHLNSAWTEPGSMNLVPPKSCKNEMFMVHSVRTGREDVTLTSVFLEPVLVYFSLFVLESISAGCTYSTRCTGAPPCYRTSALRHTEGWVILLGHSQRLWYSHLHCLTWWYLSELLISHRSLLCLCCNILWVLFLLSLLPPSPTC